MQSHMMLLRAEMVGKDKGALARREPKTQVEAPAPLFARWRRRSTQEDGRGAMAIIAAQNLKNKLR